MEKQRNASKLWHLRSPGTPPEWMVAMAGRVGAQLLWQRGLRDRDAVAAFLDPEAYVPTPALAFGGEMERAVDRLARAYAGGERVAIWGDFDADGITATAVLWEGLGHFFPQGDRLAYAIPNRLVESHGLSIAGIDRLLAEFSGCGLIVTCDTGCTNAAEIAYARSRGVDVIVTDHHTLPEQRPAAVAVVNPRLLECAHPLYHLSGVAVAYKLMEAVYDRLASEANVPPVTLEELLDLVAVGLVADLVELVGDCRYLAQRGIAKLKEKARPGLELLLDRCNKAGDRATDISFGIAPRLNAVSRIWGDASRCVELLVSRDRPRCSELAAMAELANQERLALQKKLLAQVRDRIASIDLSTTGILVIEDSRWPAGILGLVAGQVASEYGRPAVLCAVEDGVARCSARSVAGIDLYDLIKGQERLLLGFGGHPLAGGMSLLAENLPLLRESLEQRYWSQYRQPAAPTLEIDVELTVADLGQSLFRELKRLEPYGMGNPSPLLLVRNAQFRDRTDSVLRTLKGRKLDFPKADFVLEDATGKIHGHGWGYRANDLPEGTCDAVVELVDNPRKKRYEVRLVAWRRAAADGAVTEKAADTARPAGFVTTRDLAIFDRRQRGVTVAATEAIETMPDDRALACDVCPASWQSLERLLAAAREAQCPIVLNYSPPDARTGMSLWLTLVGMAKYLARTGKTVPRSRVLERLEVAERELLALGESALAALGYDVAIDEATDSLQIVSGIADLGAVEGALSPEGQAAIARFVAAADEALFRQRYFDRQLLQLASG